MRDPAAAFQTLMAAYSRVLPMPDYVAGAEVNEKGVRASFRRARIDQQDASELRMWIAAYGKRIPAILKEVLQIDTALRGGNLSFEAAKVAARFGAPAIESEIPQYERRMAAQARQEALQARNDHILATILAMQKSGHMPKADAELDLISEVLEDPRFQHDADPRSTLLRAAAITRHPNHVRRTTARSAPRGPDKSIHGAGGADSAGNRYGGTSIRESCRPGDERVMGKVLQMFPIPKVLLGKISQSIWDIMHPTLRDECQRMADELTNGMAKYAEGAARDAELAEFHSLAELQGTTVAEALKRYISMEDAIKADPVEGLVSPPPKHGPRSKGMGRAYP